MDQWSSRAARARPTPSCARDAIYEEGTNLSKITVEQEPGVADTLLTAELDDTHTAPTFAELGVRTEIVRALDEIGIQRTFAIQELTLPLALAGEDLIGQARTGMGKTFGFGVPLLHRIATTDSGTTPLDGTPRALIIVPTRELCIQVTQDLENASKYLRNQKGPLKVTSIYGGRPYESQIAALREGVDVVVGTPGRLQDLAEQQHLVLGKVGVLVLDEADEMLDLGFLPDIERILNMVPQQRQTMLFSATMPGPIITLARTFLNRPTHIRAEEANATTITERISQFVYRAHALDKSELVSRILQAESRGATMVFARTKRTAQKVADDLAERGFAVGAVHGDLNQVQREKALKKFREGKIDVLVATDVAARGIDIDDVTHVVNYQCPEDEKTYVHRIGRTGRAGRHGVAITLVDWDELNRWSAIDSALRLGIPEPVETYSRSPHLYTDLGIPEGVTGVIRKRKPERDEDAVVVEREARAPRKRNRRRTRGGQPVDDAATTGSDATTGSSADGAGDAEGDKPGRRRRRRRGRGGSDEAAGSARNTDDAANADAAEAVSSDNGSSATESDEARADRPGRRRRRRRGGADRTDRATGTDTADASAPVSAEGAADHRADDAAQGSENADSTVLADEPRTAPHGNTDTAAPNDAATDASKPTAAEEGVAPKRSRTRRAKSTAAESSATNGAAVTDAANTAADASARDAESASAAAASAADSQSGTVMPSADSTVAPNADPTVASNADSTVGPKADATVTRPKRTRTRRTAVDTTGADTTGAGADAAVPAAEAVATAGADAAADIAEASVRQADSAAKESTATSAEGDTATAAPKRTRRKATAAAGAPTRNTAATAETDAGAPAEAGAAAGAAAAQAGEAVTASDSDTAAPQRTRTRRTKAATETGTAATEPSSNGTGTEAESEAGTRKRTRRKSAADANATTADDTTGTVAPKRARARRTKAAAEADSSATESNRNVENGSDAAGTGAAGAVGTATTGAADAAGTGAADAAAPKRTRTRRTKAAAEDEAAATTSSRSADDAADATTDAAPKRTRARRAKADTAAAEAGATAGDTTSNGSAAAGIAEGAAPAQRRRRRKAEEGEVVTAEADTAVAATA